MCHQTELLMSALHDANEEYSIWSVETELYQRVGEAEQSERAKIRAGYLRRMCGTLREVLISHLSEDGCAAPQAL